MKISTLLSSACIVLSLLFISCNSHFSLTKRHYNKGYHISSYHTPSSVNKSNKSPVVKSFVEKPNIEVLDKRTIQGEIRNELPSKKTIISQEPLADGNLSNKTYIPIAAPTVANTGKPIANPSNTTIGKITKTGFQNNIQKINSERQHSLLWIVIVAILIIWLIGFLLDGFGLGWLIHILLVVALVLLILWLLGIA